MSLTTEDLQAIKHIVDASIDAKVPPMFDAFEAKFEDKIDGKLQRLEDRLTANVDAKLAALERRVTHKIEDLRLDFGMYINQHQ